MISPVAKLSPWLLALLVFAVAFFQGTRNNQFPWFYHTDEPSKAEQLLGGDRNFFHPALMLNSTVVVARVLGIPLEKQAMVVTGRTVSAFFAALALVGFTLVAWRSGGWCAGLLAGVFCILSADFFDAAHYMKEDPYWISGLSFTFFAALQYWKKPGWFPALALGLAAGWSVAGKYIGFISLLVAVLTILGKWFALARESSPTPRRAGFPELLICLFAATALFLVINYQILANPQSMSAGLGKEVGALFNEHHQRNDKFKPTRYLDLLQDSVPATGIALAAGLLLFRLWTWKKTSLPEWLLLLLPVFLLVALTLTPKGSARYFLPIGLMLLTSAAIALGSLARHLAPARLPWRVLGLAVGTWLAVSIILPLHKEYRRHYRAFANDHRKNLAAYIRENIPPSATIASDQRAAMPSADDPRYAGFPDLLPQKMLITRYTADLGTMDALIARGVSHVVVASRDANRLGNDENFSAQDQKKLPARRAFYLELAQRGTVEWQSKLGANKYLNVSLILYRIAPAAP